MPQMAQEQNQQKIRRGLSGSTLKLIAIGAMLVDHIGAVLLEPCVLAGASMALYYVYLAMRLVIGRIAFPIFCFLLTEGFQRTSNRGKYASRLGAFALASEIPFDLAFNGALLEFTSQNVMFTLLLGFAGMWCIDVIMSREGWKRWLKVVLCILTSGVLLAAGEFLSTDYGAYGVACILVLYLFRGGKLTQVLAGTAAIWVGDLVCGMGGSELLAPLGLIPVYHYNGKRGLRLKYVFYIFYPAHLLLLALVARGLGLA